MRKHFITILFFLLSASTKLPAQGDPLLRIELDAPSDAVSYRVVTAGEKGVVLFYQTGVVEENYKFWVFVLYDKMLKESWKKEVPLLKNMIYSKSRFHDNNLYFLMYDSDRKKPENYNYQVVKINLNDGSYELFSGEIPNNAEIEDFEIAGDLLFAGLNINNSYSGVYSLNMSSKETSAVSEHNGNLSRFEEIYYDSVSETVLAIFNIFESKTQFYFLVEEYGKTGNIINSCKINPGQGKKFVSCRIERIDDNERLVIGSYSAFKGSSISSKQYFEKGTSGFFAVNIKNFVAGTPNYYNFIKLDNNTGYLKSKDILEAKKKALKAEDAEEKYSLDFGLLFHDIIRKDSLFYFVAEAYYEQYHTVTSTYYDYYGRMIPTTYSVFDGFRYFNAYVLCFDNNGTKMWDNGMEILNVISYDLYPRLVIFFNGDDIVLAYNYDGKIAAKIINGPNTVEGVDYFPIETSFIRDKLIDDTKSGMMHWYDNYFIAYGFQTIKNNAYVNRNKRLVFYINKIVFK